MRTFKVLVLTDHSGHSKSNSFYGVVNALRVHKNIEKIDVASKGMCVISNPLRLSEDLDAT